MQTEDNISVLVIEDQRELAHNISRYFEPLGYLTDFAYTGTQGLSLALENYYDVIILDVMLPGKSGFEILKELRADTAFADLPILMLTARGQSRDRDIAQDAGVSRFMTKPFSNEEMLSAVRDLTASGTADA